MFIGHWAPALAAAAVAPRAPKLGLLFVAAQLVDWGFFVFASIGIEKLRVVPGITKMVPLDLYHMPFTHSLIGTLGWAIVFGVLIFAITREFGAAIIAGAVVTSHWLLDLLVHRPDLTIAGGTEKLGFGLWNYPWIAIPLELAITFGALIWYVRRTRGPIGQPIILGVVLLTFQIINWLGPAPQEAGLELYLLALLSFAVVTALASWVGRTRIHRYARG